MIDEAGAAQRILPKSKQKKTIGKAEIEEIMDRLAGWYDVHVFYASEEAKHIRFSGILDRNDSITLCLERMESTGTVHFKQQGNSITVYKP